MKIYDLFVLAALLITALGGYRSGLIQTAFKAIGYIIGGVLGVALSVQVLSNYSQVRFKLIIAVILTFSLASIGEFVLGKIGSLFRKAIFIPHFKQLDSFLGAALSSARTVFVIYILSAVLTSTSIDIGGGYISNSRFYSYANSHLPNVITDLKVKVEQLLNQIT